MRTILVLSLVASLQAQDAEPEGDSFEGTWYLKALVANKQMPEAMKPKKSFPVTVTALDDGSYEVQLSFLYKNKCQEKTVEMRRTKDPKKFETTQNAIVSVEEMSVRGHFIFYIEHQVFGMPVRIAKLMARTPEGNPEALREFKKFMKRRKLPVQYLVIPQQSKNCVSLVPTENTGKGQSPGFLEFEDPSAPVPFLSQKDGATLPGPSRKGHPRRWPGV